MTHSLTILKAICNLGNWISLHVWKIINNNNDSGLALVFGKSSDINSIARCECVEFAVVQRGL